MERESFIFYKSFYESIKELAPEEQVIIYNAIFEFEFYGIYPELKGFCKSIFTLIIPQLEANNKRYENGKKGGRPKKENNQNETKAKPNNNQNETKTKPNKNVNVNDNENHNDNVNKNENKENYFLDSELNDMFLDFLKMRKKMKAVNSDRAINGLLNILNKYDDDTKKEMINNSIVNSWKSVYELKKPILEKTPKRENNQRVIEKEPQWMDSDDDIMSDEELAEFEKQLRGEK